MKDNNEKIEWKGDGAKVEFAYEETPKEPATVNNSPEKTTDDEFETEDKPRKKTWLFGVIAVAVMAMFAGALLWWKNSDMDKNPTETAEETQTTTVSQETIPAVNDPLVDLNCGNREEIYYSAVKSLADNSPNTAGREEHYIDSAVSGKYQVVEMTKEYACSHVVYTELNSDKNFPEALYVVEEKKYVDGSEVTTATMNIEYITADLGRVNTISAEVEWWDYVTNIILNPVSEDYYEIIVVKEDGTDTLNTIYRMKLFEEYGEQSEWKIENSYEIIGELRLFENTYGGSTYFDHGYYSATRENLFKEFSFAREHGMRRQSIYASSVFLRYIDANYNVEQGEYYAVGYIFLEGSAIYRQNRTVHGLFTCVTNEINEYNYLSNYSVSEDIEEIHGNYARIIAGIAGVKKKYLEDGTCEYISVQGYLIETDLGDLGVIYMENMGPDENGVNQYRLVDDDIMFDEVFSYTEEET
ncbi:MAG: hypothetical protein K6F92_01770 [Lachnospiraceae bacterium]|nr:hypothetical protein [Lachnospiraceae bacterium]